jgi:hypothetical protein
MTNELERIWKEAVANLFKALSRYLPGGTEEDHEKPQSGSPGQDLNPGLAEYVAGVLTAQLRF